MPVPKGKRYGGRQKGTKNKATVEKERVLAEFADKTLAAGVTPLEVMLGAMREAWNKQDAEAAARFARDAAPYVHPKLAAIEHSGPDGKPLMPDASPADIAAAMLAVLREAQLEKERADKPT